MGRLTRLAEHTEADADDGHAQEKGQQRIGRHNGPHRADRAGDHAGSTGQQAGDSHLSSLNVPLPSKDLWLRELDSNQQSTASEAVVLPLHYPAM